MVGARLSNAIIDVCFAICTTPTIITFALVLVDEIVACTMSRAVRVGTFIDIYLAIASSIAWVAFADVIIDAVDAISIAV